MANSVRFSGFPRRVAALAMLALAVLSVRYILAVEPASVAPVQIVYDNGAYIGSPSLRSLGDFAVADDFFVSESLAFNGIRFYSAGLPDNNTSLASFSGTISWFLYTDKTDDSRAMPGSIPSATPFASGTTRKIIVTNTGQDVNGFRVYQLDIPIPPQSLSRGRYWLRLKEGAPSDAYDESLIGWWATNSRRGNGFRSDRSAVSPSAWDTDGTATTTDLSYQFIYNTAASSSGQFHLSFLK